MPSETQEETTLEGVALDQSAIERSEGVLDSLFSDALPKKEEKVKPDKPDKPEKVAKKPVEEEDEEEVEEEEVPEKESDEEIPDDGEVDWDSSEKKKPEEEEEPDLADETVARREAKKQGRAAKQLRAELTERNLELDNTKKELEEHRLRLAEIEATKIRPEDHPEYSKLRLSILKDVTEGADLLAIPDSSLVRSNLGEFMAGYQEMSSLEGEKRTAARTKLKGAIVDRLKLSEISYAEMDEDERAAVDSVATQVMSIVQRNAGKTEELSELHSTLLEKASKGQIAVGLRAYEATVKDFRPALDAVGDLAEDLVEANPHSIDAVVTKLAKTTPEGAARLEKAKSEVLDILAGPRALTQKEIDKLEASGEDVKTFMAERAKAHRAKQVKYASMFVQSLMTRSVFSETLSKLAKYEKSENDESSEFDALQKVTKKPAVVKKKEVRPKDRANPLDSMFGSED